MKPGASVARIDFTSQRLFLDAALAPGARVPLDRGQANYLLNVLRFRPGDALLVFNGRDGEWRATLAPTGRKAAALAVEAQVRPQPVAGGPLYAFAPLKQARLDYMVQKAVEMGAGALQAVVTQHTQGRTNPERMRANAIEAAEQCGVLAVPAVRPEARFERWLADLPAPTTLVFCDEDAPEADPLVALRAVGNAAAQGLAVLIGPEGGFAAAERTALLARPGVVRLSLGPRILRADTAGVAALALIQAVLGDWRDAADQKIGMPPATVTIAPDM